ncbi:MAG: hypothetical protein IPJ98_16740 [Bryobacterales bacterium]|nr:hypothetical protein [Bryobacterales bacterium]
MGSAGEDGWVRTRKLLEGGDFLQAAEMLQRELPRPTFIKYVESVFGEKRDPNDIHRSIARLPFSLALTTNFDLLLEAASIPPRSRGGKPMQFQCSAVEKVRHSKAPWISR